MYGTFEKKNLKVINLCLFKFEYIKTKAFKLNDKK